MLGADIALHEVSLFQSLPPNGLSNHALEQLLMHLLRSLVLRGNEGAGIVSALE